MPKPCHVLTPRPSLHILFSILQLKSGKAVLSSKRHSHKLLIKNP